MLGLSATWTVVFCSFPDAQKFDFHLPLRLCPQSSVSSLVKLIAKMRITTIFKNLYAECTECLICMCYLLFGPAPKRRSFLSVFYEMRKLRPCEIPLFSLVGAFLIGSRTAGWELAREAGWPKGPSSPRPGLNLGVIIYWLCYLVSPLTALSLSFPICRMRVVRIYLIGST